tara:strand:+ start:280 stop:621 length:342 start_codon:yes stop_codon:yes gene_type:complete
MGTKKRYLAAMTFEGGTIAIDNYLEGRSRSGKPVAAIEAAISEATSGLVLLGAAGALRQTRGDSLAVARNEATSALVCLSQARAASGEARRKHLNQAAHHFYKATYALEPDGV